MGVFGPFEFSLEGANLSFHGLPDDLDLIPSLGEAVQTGPAHIIYIFE